jgi:hypothetical protein
VSDDLHGGTLDAVRERRRGLRSALDELERAVAAPSSGRPKEWAAGVVQRAEALQDAFREHVEVTEGRDGLFDEIVGHAPRLAPRVDKLRADHRVVAAGLAEVLEELPAIDPDQDVEDLKERVIAVMGSIVRHRHVGASLVYEAYFVDVEAAD